jgi:hypothetical protein
MSYTRVTHSSPFSDGSATDLTVLLGAMATGLEALENSTVFNVKNYGAKGDGTTDDTTAIQNAINAAGAAGGGIVYFPIATYKVTGQLTFPLDTSTTVYTQRSIKLVGAGSWSSGQGGLGSGGSRLILTYASGTYNNAKIVTYGVGQLTLDNLILQDTTASAITPFLMTTNTTLKISNCAFLGATGLSSCAQDAIVLGGTTKVTGFSASNNATDAPFQGYGTVIQNTAFHNIRRAVYGRSFCNGIVFRDNLIGYGCGTNLANGAPIEFDGSLFPGWTQPVDGDTGNVVSANVVELTGGYTYGVKLVKASWNHVSGNGFYDPSAAWVSAVRCEGVVDGANRPATGNYILGNFIGGGTHLSEDTMSTNFNVLVGDSSGGHQGIRLVGNVKIDPSDQANIQIGSTTFYGNALTYTPTTTNWDANFTLNPNGTGQGYIVHKYGGVNAWQVGQSGANVWKVRDMANSQDPIVVNKGTATTARIDMQVPTEFYQNIGFYGTAPASKQTVTGSRGGNAALASLITALATIGLITDSTTA